jgi:hypothetical protein
VFSKRIAPRTRLPVKLGLVMIRERIRCMSANISASPEYASGGIPYCARAFGVLPPLWSSAAMKPVPNLTLWSCCSSMGGLTSSHRSLRGPKVRTLDAGQQR